MRQRLVWSEVLLHQREGKLHELSKGGRDSTAKVQKICEVNEVEVKQIQEETATSHHQNFLELQMRLHVDRITPEKMQEENQCLNQQVDTLTVEVMALRNKALQDLLLAKTKALEAVEEKNLSLQNEISLLKSTFGGEKGTEVTHFHLVPELLYLDHSPDTSGSKKNDSPQPAANEFSPQSFQLASAATLTSRITTAPRLAKSAGANKTTQKRVLAQGSANIESPKWSLSLDPNTLGQGQDYFISLFTDSEKNAQHPGPWERLRTPSATKDYNSSASRNSATGNLRIAEVHSGGYFVKILNCSPDKEESIGEYILQQNINGHPVAVFRFPPRIRMKANSAVTVWTADAKVLPKPPSDFLWKEQDRCNTGPECTTILCEPNGQAVAWYTPIHWNRKPGWEEQKDDANLNSNRKPTIPAKVQRDRWVKEPESLIINTVQEGAVQGQTEERGSVFIKREKKIPATLFPIQNSWCRSPASPTHPHFSLLRPLTMGNDGSSLCRQSRCQSAKPDPPPGTLYAGTRRVRNSATCSFNGKSSRRLTRSAGPKGGVMYIGSPAPTGSALQKYFANSPYTFSLPNQASFTPGVGNHRLGHQMPPPACLDSVPEAQGPSLHW
ncbi:lamin tail domain-containing protein 1 isoform X2 [Pelodiscus sinensis]|uniref:lamin tail domain-containing protein 1 isoform X2 n=1 Tax=Pelodiscus sinensis TaxID=13735 RepID=UPI003F6BE02C